MIFSQIAWVGGQTLWCELFGKLDLFNHCITFTFAAAAGQARVEFGLADLSRR
jgi:hypothetical protein